MIKFLSNLFNKLLERSLQRKSNKLFNKGVNNEKRKRS